MLARPLNESDKGERGLTCVTLSPSLLLVDNVSETQTGVSSPPPVSCASSSPSFFPAPVPPPSLTPSDPLPCSPPSLNFLTPTSVPLSVLPPPLPPSVSSSTPFVLPPLVAPCLPPSSSSHSLSPPNFSPSSVVLSASLHAPSHSPSSVSLPPLAPTLLSSTSPSRSSSSSPLLPQFLYPLPRTICPLTHNTVSPPPITSPAPPPPLAFISSPPLSSAICPPSLLLTIHSSPTLSSTSLSLPSPHDSPPFSSAAPSLLYHHISSPASPPPPPPASSVVSPSPLAFLTSSPTSPPSPVSPSPPHTSAFLPDSPALHPPPPPLACCSCSSLLPRLLSAHRLEVRRLLRGALASLGRRLDSLEKRASRKRRRRRRKRSSRQGGECLAESSFSPAPIPTVASSSSSLSSIFFSDNKDLSKSPFSLSVSQSEQKTSSKGQEEVRVRKRRTKKYSDKGEEEEDAGRFVGQMRVSFTGGEGKEKELLTLHDFNHRSREQGRICKSPKATTVIRQNGYSICDGSSQHTLHLLQSGQSSQSEALCVSLSQWHFSDLISRCSLSSGQTLSRLRLCFSFSLAPMMLLSAVSVETVSELFWCGAFGSPLRPLKDWTAPPSLSSDHCYVQPPTLSLTFSARQQQKQRANHVTWSFHLPQRQTLPLPPCSVNGLSAPFPADQSASGPKFLSRNGECSKRVSQIRIRRATPRETPLTPMGLPKVKRLKKKEFSLEEIYTNKNYKSPTTNRSLETIFEEPREKDGALLLIGQQRRRRLLLFPDFTQPRKRKRPQGVGLPVALVPRKRMARRHCHSEGSGDDDIDLDVMLVERLSALEDFMTRQGLDV